MKRKLLRPLIFLLTALFFAPLIPLLAEEDCPAQPTFPEISAEEVNMAFERLACAPRLLLTAERMERAKRRIAADSRLAAYAESLKKWGDSLLDLPCQERVMEGRRLLAVSRSVLGRVFVLSFLYRLTGEEKYALRGKQETLSAARFSDWNPSHFLDVAEMTTAVAIGYDSLGDFFTDEERTEVRNAIRQKGIEPSANGAWMKNPANWNQVCHTGMLFGALALADEEPDLARRIVRRSVNGVTWSMASYEPDGNYTEGPGYWGYGTGFNIMMLAALSTALSTDFGRSDAPGFLKSIRYYENVFGPTGLAYNYPDSGGGKIFEPTVYWYAEKLGDASIPWNENRLLAESSPDSFVQHRLAPMALLWGAEQAEETPPSELGYVGIGNGLCPVALFRTSWSDPAAAYLGVKAGTPSSPHGHMDAGSFVYENQGIRWGVELGPERYHTIESRGMNLWSTAQNGDRWKLFRYNNFSHNTLTVWAQEEQNRVESDALQRVQGKSLFLETHIGAAGEDSSATIDLGPVYAGMLQRAIRRLTLSASGTLTVVDELTAPSERGVVVEWRMLTPATVERVRPDEVILTHPDPLAAKKDRKNVALRLRAESDRPLEIVTAPAETDREYDAKNPGVTIVIVRMPLDAGAASTLTVTADRVGSRLALPRR